MGYDTDVIRIHIRLDAHGDERQDRDQEAFKELEEEIRLLIQSNPRYARIAEL